MSNLAKPTTPQVVPPEAVDSNSTLREPHRLGTPPREFWVETVRDVEALMAHQLAWDDLAAHAIERNPFYESWMLINGVKHFGSNVDLQFKLVWQRNPCSTLPPTLVGLFPLERQRSFGGIPLRLLKIWQHQYLYYCVPLVRRGVASEVLHALFDQMSQGKSRATAIELHHIDGSGPFAQALLEVTNERAASTFTVESYNRALFRPARDYDAYIAVAMTNHNRQEVRRQRRRLAERGDLEIRVLSEKANVEEWINHFLQLEVAGWKGQEATALASRETSQTYFETIARAAFARGQLMMVGLFLDQHPIALKCNFLAAEGSYAFKIAFDEAYAKYSPGVQLELENIRLLHQMPEIHWMDSCATRQHFMIGRLWADRRTIQKVIVSTGRWFDNLTVDAIASLSAIRKAFRRPPRCTAFHPSEIHGADHA